MAGRAPRRACLPAWLAAAMMLAATTADCARAAPPAVRAAAARTDAATLPAAGDALLGRTLAETEGCYECHDPARPAPPAGQGPDTVWPRLTGQPADYLVKQLQDFRSGERKNDTMGIMARSLDEPATRHLAAYFASLPAHVAAGAADPAQQAQGQRLYTQGDSTRGIPACVTCHDSASPTPGRAADARATPRLTGQDPRYLASQLRAWRSRERHNSPGQVMNQAAAGLTDDDILALSAHLGAP